MQGSSCAQREMPYFHCREWSQQTCQQIFPCNLLTGNRLWAEVVAQGVDRTRTPNRFRQGSVCSTSRRDVGSVCAPPRNPKWVIIRIPHLRSEIWGTRSSSLLTSFVRRQCRPMPAGPSAPAPGRRDRRPRKDHGRVSHQRRHRPRKRDDQWAVGFALI
jgi:hypothetical protein